MNSGGLYTRFGMLGVLFGILVWFVDALVDSLFFNDGSYLDSLISAEPVEYYMHSGAMLLFILFGYFAQRMVARKFALQAQLARSEEKFRMLVESTSDLLWSLDRDGLYSYVSPKVGDLLGYEPAAMIGQSPDLFMDEASAADVRRRLEAAPGYRHAFQDLEHGFMHADGRQVLLESSGVPVFDETGAFAGYRGISRDITARKEAERKHRASELRFATIIDQADDAIISIDRKQRIVLFNRAAEQMFGYTGSEIIGRPYEWLIPEEQIGEFHRMVAGVEQGERGKVIRRRYGGRCRRRNGTLFPVESSISRQLFGAEQVMTIILRDVSERERMEEIYRKLSRSLDAAGEGVVITDTGGRIEYVNPAFTKATGYALSEAVGNNISILRSEVLNPQSYSELRRTIRAGEAWHGSLSNQRKDGTVYPILVSVAPIHNELGEITHYVALQQDMSDYNRLEGQYLQAQKMEAIGTLVGGIAHDFNNLLGAIQGNNYLARMRMQQGRVDEAAEKLSHIDQLTATAGSMVSQLLSFSRKGKVEMRDFSLSSFIKEALKLAASIIPEDIELISDIDSENLHIVGDLTQMQQTLMNLLVNARDAVESVAAPRIVVTLQALYPDQRLMQLHPEMVGVRLARLSVRDNGPGIPDEIAEKVFEPFFTTKEPGRGTGLGLAMVYGCVHGHGGFVEINNRAGEGADIEIYLPLSDAQQKSAKPPGRPMLLKGHGELLLLVDDDNALRSSMAEMLGELGYRTLQAADGQAALEIAIEQGRALDLLITDVVMPGMGGVKLARELRERGSTLPVIFMSGYEHGRESANRAGVIDSMLVEKPFDVATLTHHIHRMCRERSVSGES